MRIFQNFKSSLFVVGFRKMPLIESYKEPKLDFQIISQTKAYINSLIIEIVLLIIKKI